jgi:putative FmdB family regulatory protein
VPTYSYACTECDNRFDAVQAFTDDALTTCPRCSGRLRKLFNSVGVVFKGSGFYRTDSRESGASKNDGSPPPASGSSPASGSEKSSAEKSSASSSDSGSSTSGAAASSSAPAPSSN